MSGLQRFLEDTRGVDTIPLKMVVYLAITALVVVLAAVSWNNISPVMDDADVDRQLEDAALKISSIQHGYAREITSKGTDGSMCTVELSMPEHVNYVAFGVDPDPDADGNLTNTAWSVEDYTILCSYASGVKTRVLISGEPVNFRKGIFDDGKWVFDEDGYSYGNISEGVVIEGPITGDFTFELVFDGKKQTLSHF
ncbi:hypothetical protein LI82_09355 [Methanococcoides methylutens]|uniref:Uncharacterized protein n=1 Tax=Methanococcoides methylutens TaxID=2226 RepID=A0A099SZ19_METMT|nr:hypothetical protein [Methanococcoides methylutens]KGK97949.1 hypothetical protein LI82_09355 [Methanococcoides methylutens]